MKKKIVLLLFILFCFSVSANPLFTNDRCFSCDKSVLFCNGKIFTNSTSLYYEQNNGTITDLLNISSTITTINSTLWNRTGTNTYLANTGDNVGIGTDTPDEKLHVDSGNIKIVNEATNTALIGEVYSDSASQRNFYRFNKARGTESVPTNTLLGDSIGSYDWYGYANNAFRPLAQIIVGQDSASSGNNIPSRMDFKVSDATGQLNNFMRLDSTGFLGIMDTSPDAWEEIVGDGVTEYFMVSSTAGNDGDIFIVDGDGDVGIGNINPSAKLDVIGDVEFEDTVITFDLRSTEGSGNTFRLQNRAGGVNAFKLVDSTNSLDRLTIETGSGNQDAWFENINNFGINTETPSTTFDVNGNATIRGSLNVTTGFTGSCVNVTYSGGIAVSCND